MNIWQVLGIAPTHDEAEIRRAYAQQLKTHRPDRDPEGYQRLREAFDSAKQQVQGGATPILIDILPQSQPPVAEAAFPLAKTFYTSEEMQALAHQLVNTEMVGIVAMKRLWTKIASQGSLLQQQQFHQHLAAALSEEQGLTEGLLERVSGLLTWGIDEYDYSHIIPEPIQHAIQQRLRETEVNRAWRQMSTEETHGTLLAKTAVRLLKSNRKHVPFWIRLAPGLLQALVYQAQHLTSYYPEIAERLNPLMLEFLRQTRLTLSWQGIFLLVFWGMAFKSLLQQPDIHHAASITAIVIVVFYLYLSDILMMGFSGKPRWLSCFLFMEFMFSLAVIQLFFGGLFFAAVITIPPSGHGSMALVSLLAVLALCIMFWVAWPKGVPFIRKPGIIMSRIFSSPWKMIEWMNFTWFSAIWAILYFIICVGVLSELLKLFK
ncbi:J domain-containing protein [Pectobacterium parmentieri]|uniref:J domain-containing protein n=1 Tax=Pectobacterium parmentieri TaxID=1905730 RepID=UPI001374329F|nr:J domain-containing protein [Pectobacterium parmentieri]QHQ16484.1 J domain-containing protein [Pectobacterium parmentieri]